MKKRGRIIRRKAIAQFKNLFTVGVKELAESVNHASNQLTAEKISTL